MIGKVAITVTDTADGKFKYVQIASPAAMPVNIVLICDEVEIKHMDARNPGETVPSTGSKRGAKKR